MAAVQLAHRQQVEHGDQAAEPCRKAHGIEVYGIVLGQRAVNQVRERLKHQGFAEVKALSLTGNEIHPGADQAVRHDRDRHDESGDGAGGADVHQGLPVRVGRLRHDDGAKGARVRCDEEEGRRYEMWQGGVDAVPPGVEIVAHFVGHEDA